MELTRRGFLVAVAAALAASTASCSGAARPAVAIATGEPGGTYIRFGELLRASLDRRGSAGLEVVETNGSVQNLALLAAGEADLALSLADATGLAASGAVAIGRVYQNYLQCVVREDGPVRDVADLAGLAVSLGAPGSGAAVTAERALTALGIAPSRSAPERELTLREAVHALEDGSIDAFFWSGGVPTPEIDALDARVGIRLVDLGPAVRALAATHAHLYAATPVPAGVYASADPVTTIGVSNLLLARPGLDDAVAASLVDALVEDARALVPAGSLGVQYLTAANLIDTAPLPLHPGAERRYRERYG